MDIEGNIGVSTLLLKEAGAQAIMSVVNRGRRAGFKAIEIAPAQFHPVAGRNASSFLETAFGEEERGRLRRMLRPFSVVTVHGSGVIIKVCGDEGREEELWRPYVELMRFAHDIGAHIVTFHPLRRGEGASLSDDEMADYHIEFGRLAAEYAKEWNLLTGFELFENKIIDRIDSRRFGFLFDIGHAAVDEWMEESSRNVTAHVLQMVEERIDKTIQFHAHGVQITPTGLKDHRPLDKNNVLDYAQIMRLLMRKKYDGPIIFEILCQTARREQLRASFQDNLDACTWAKKQLIKHWM